MAMRAPGIVKKSEIRKKTEREVFQNMATF